jgi:glycine oxidase
LTRIDNEYRRSGGLYIARSPAERATLKANCYWWEELGVGYERLSQDQVSRKSPIILPSLHDRQRDNQEAHYYWVPGDAKLRNTRHLAALKAACDILDVKVFERTEVIGFQTDGIRIRGLDCGAALSSQVNRGLVADRYCISTGAWTAPLLGSLGIETGIYPVRGQMQLYRFDKVPFRFVVNEGHRYLVPREDGRVLVGSCEEEVGFVKATTEEMMQQLQHWSVGVCPAIAKAELEMQWSGLRPGSIDGFPYLGTLFPYDNCFIAAGHFRHGLHWSTATAVLMAQHMSGELASIDLEPFRIQRGNVLSHKARAFE